MGERNKHEHGEARRAFAEIVDRAGATAIRQALASAMEEQGRGNAGLFFSDENMGHPPNYILAIQGDVAHLELRNYFQLPTSEVAEMLSTESTKTNPE